MGLESWDSPYMGPKSWMARPGIEPGPPED